MLKSGLKDMPVITIHLNPSDKEKLKELANSKGLRLAEFCRMMLLELIKEAK